MIKRTGTICLTILFAGGLLWLILPPAAHAAADIEASIVFGPEVVTPTNGLQVGDVFTARVRLASTTNQRIDTYGFYLTYSQTVVSIRSITPLHAPANFSFCAVPISFDNSTGRTAGQCADLTGGISSNGVDLMEISFEVLQTNGRFDLLFDQFCDGAGNGECFQLLSSGINQMGTYNDASDTPTAVQLLGWRVGQPVEYGVWGSLFFLVVVSGGMVLRHLGVLLQKIGLTIK